MHALLRIACLNGLTTRCHSEQRGLETWRNIGCNILRSVFQWRLLHAAALGASTTGNLVSTLPTMSCAKCFSGGGYTLKHYLQRGKQYCAQHFVIGGCHTLEHNEQRGQETWFQHCLQYCARRGSVEVATCCNITCNEDCKPGF